MKVEFERDKLIKRVRQNTFFVYWFKRIFIDDWLMKVVALAITLALWLGVTGFRTPITRPVNNVSLNTLVSKDLEITNSLVPEVDIEITGDKRKVDQINGRDLAVTIDLTDLQEGDRTVHLTPQGISVELPSGVAVTKISPDKIAVKLERVEETEVPVRVETEGAPAAGYEVYSKKAAPPRVRVRGPASFVKSLSFVSTDKIDLQGKTKGFVVHQVSLNVSDSKISLTNDVTASVAFQIGRKRIERLIVVPYETETRSGRANVTLIGPEEVLENLTPEEIIVIEVEAEDGRSRLDLVLPSVVKEEVQVKSVKYRE